MIRTQELTVVYDRDNLVLDRVSVTIETGKIVGIIGPNGAGKSSFLKALLGLIAYDGQVSLAGQTGREIPECIAYVEQKSQIDNHFPITVRECVSLGLYKEVGLFRRLKKSDWTKVDTVLERVGLSKYAKVPISNLSGGQFQRMLVARCLVQETQIIFLDEPFVGIDAVSESIIMDILKNLRNQGRTILIVHHDLSKVKRYFDTVMILNKKRLAYGPVEQVFTVENLRKAYEDTIFLEEEVE